MQWIEAAINAGGGDIDELCAQLCELGVGGMVVEDERDFKDFLENNRQYWDYVDEGLEKSYEGVSRVKFYLSDDEDGRAVLDRVRAAGLEPTLSLVEDSDWENGWRQYYKPIETGRRLVVVPAWEELPGGERLPLRLDPGLSFGTGSHATTRMCLCELEDAVSPGVQVLDLGCGSGILGIAALLLGAESVSGCDIDPKSPEVALSNAGLNGFGAERLDLRAGDILVDAGLRRALGTGYGVVLANIVANVIIPLCGYVRDFLAPGGIFITSGIIEGRQAEVEHALSRAGLTIISHRCEEEWHCYRCLAR